uniref:AraC family ligand binding domain-containing protein n=1 Tax=Gelidibacter sp. TaxID=2018083 RepID=UPI00404A7AD0
MAKDIPQINFKPAKTDNFGFEIVSIEKIAQKKNQNNHNSELPHQLNFYNLIFFTEGTGRHFIDFKWHKVQQNTLAYLSKGQINAFDFSKSLKGFCLIFTEEFFIECLSKLSEDFVFRLFNPQIFSPIVEIPVDSDFKTYFNLLKNEFSQTETLNQKNIIESLFSVLISKAEDIKRLQTIKIKDSTKIKTFQKFILLIEQHLSTSRSAVFYAKELAITYKYLNTICKELVN